MTATDQTRPVQVPVGPTLRVIDELLGRGWSKSDIARALGSTGDQGLRMGPAEITVARAAAIAALLDEDPPRPRPGRAWTGDAACKGMDPDLFHPAQGGDARPAKEICAGCPVRRPCLDWAVAHREHLGVWGGLSALERARARGVR